MLGQDQKSQAKDVENGISSPSPFMPCPGETIYLDPSCIQTSVKSKPSSVVHSIPVTSNYIGSASNMKSYFQVETVDGDHVQLSKKLSEISVEKALQRLQSKLQEANVSESTTISSIPQDKGISSDNPAKFQSHLRGRKLTGVKKLVPEGYNGFLLRKQLMRTSSSLSMNEKIPFEWKRDGYFDEFTIWDHDQEPGADLDKPEPLLNLDSWVQLSQLIHGE